jgi:beta-glucosidase
MKQYKDTVYKNPDAAVEDRVGDLLARMTKLEKARQLDQYFGTGFVSATHPSMVTVAANDAHILWDIVDKEVGDAGVGCIHDLYALPELSNALQRYAMEKTRLGIPILFSEEALHGLLRPGFTIFPQSITQAATWNEELVRDVGRGIAAEARSIGVCETFAPVIDLAREPRWGRMEETYGEDTHLSSRMAVAMVKGLQGDSLASDDSIIAEPKHFAGYGVPESGLNMSPALIGKHELFSNYLPVFEAAFTEGGAVNAMCSYNSIDGVPCSCDEELLTGVLRGKWGMPGFVRSDLGAINRLMTAHCVVPTAKDAILLALKAGTDMQYYDFSHEVFQNAILELLEEGALQACVLDRAVGRVLRVKFLLGLFDRPYVDPELCRSRVRCRKHIDVALNVAREGICLLKNKGGLLPLDKNIKRIAVLGPGAAEARLGDYTPYLEGVKTVSVLQGIREIVSKETQVLYVRGVNFTEDMLDCIPGECLQDGCGNPGLRGEYYDNASLEGEPAFVRRDPQIGFNWIISQPDGRIAARSFSVRWTGVLKPGETVDGRLGVSTHDSMRLWVDGRPIVECRGGGNAPQSVPFRFEAGQEYGIRLEYVKDRDGVDVTLGWSLGAQGIREAAAASASADAAVVVLGDSDKTCGEGIDRSELTLPGGQLDLLKAVYATGTPTVLVLQNGRALALPWEDDNIPAILEAWYGGEQGGRAVAEALFGGVNPSGKLPVSFPRSVGQLPCYYNKRRGGNGTYVEGGVKPLYAFGHGLSYSSFRFSGLRLSARHIPASGGLTVSFDISNTSGRAGMEVVQLYISDKISSVVRPELELKQFRKVSLEPGERKTLSFELGAKDLRMLDRNLEYVVEPGEFRVMIGSCSDKAELEESFFVEPDRLV